MAIKNLFGRGVGFGAVHWIVTHGYDSGAAPTASVDPPSPHRLSAPGFENTLLDVTTVVETMLEATAVVSSLSWIADDGATMSTPLIFTVGETGPITLQCAGVDGTAEDLSTASAVTLTVANLATGAVPVAAVALTSPLSDGTAIWTRTALQTATAGDYAAQVKVTRADATIGYYPNASGLPGMPVTMLKTVG